MHSQFVQLAPHAEITSIGPYTLTSPPTSTRPKKRIRASSRKKPVLGGVRAILISALVGSLIWYIIWELGRALLFRH